MKTVEKKQTYILTYAEYLGETAYRALLEEVYTTPKPGLVDGYSNGAHTDMTLDTFEKSAKALKPYFVEMAKAGQRLSETPQELFRFIRGIGRAAECAMYAATKGVNTHKGLVFSLGILCAAAAAAQEKEGNVTKESLIRMEQQMVCDILCGELGAIRRETVEKSHGETVYRAYGAMGVRGEALAGYPSVFELVLPVMQAGVAEKRTFNEVKLQTLLHLMSRVEDSNILSRTNPQMLANVQSLSQSFLRMGGAYREDAKEYLRIMDQIFTEQNISAGGCADLLALTIFVNSIL